MANFSEISAQTTTPYLKFVECCSKQEILFSGTLDLIPGDNVFSFTGSTPLVGSGGTLEIGKCYTVTQEYSSTTITYPVGPTSALLSNKESCEDLKCPQCITPPSACNCPDGYIEKEGECIKEITTAATYSGQLFTLKAGDKNGAYCDQGLRLYPDISSMTWPILGNGASNAAYQLKQDNGSGAVVNSTANVQSEVWGKGSNPCWTSTTGGRLNIAGVWATGFPDNQELAFEYCITIEGDKSKQYMIGIAGDNYVKFYIDGNLAVFLNTPSGSVTTPFRHWHTFPITLSPGTHVIKLAGLNFGSSAAFAAEIYDISLANFQANLMAPAVAVGNCGTSPAQLANYIIFSTKDMVGKQVANPNQPGQWECPDGGEVDFCNGTPICKVTEVIKLSCACYMVIPCDGTDTFVSNNTEFEDYIDGFINVESQELSFSGCAYIVKLEGNDCLESVDAYPSDKVPCDCKSKCYYISNTNGFLYVDSNDELQEVSSLDAKPFVKICSKVKPVPENNSKDFQIIDLGECVDGECPVQCYTLTNCNDKDLIIHSNSDSLLPYVYGTNNIVKIIGREGCWEVSLETPDCLCLIVDISSINPNYPDATATANAIGTYDGKTLYSFTYEGETYYIWFFAAKEQWVVSTGNYGDTKDTVIVAQTREYFGDCPSSIDNSFTWYPKIEGVSFTTQTCPVECDCPIDVTVTSSYETCIDCIGYIAYKLTSCTSNAVIYTLLNLEEYIGQVVKIDCGCYKVEQINYLPPNPQTVKLEDVYTTCIECTRTYWKLVDCAGEADPIITYSDLSSFEGKVVKIENCTECWEVEATTEHLNAAKVNVINEYVDCVECGAPTICECTKVTNLNTTEKTYCYYDCDNVLKQIKLAPGQTSEKVCALKWVKCPEICSCILGDYVENGKPSRNFNFLPTGQEYNGKPIYQDCFDTNTLCDIPFPQDACYTLKYETDNCWYATVENNCSTSYYAVFKNCSTSDCPIGPWEYVPCTRIQINILTEAPAVGVIVTVNDYTADVFSYGNSTGYSITFNPTLSQWELKNGIALYAILKGNLSPCATCDDEILWELVDAPGFIFGITTCDTLALDNYEFSTSKCPEDCDCLSTQFIIRKTGVIYDAVFVATGEIINDNKVYEALVGDDSVFAEIYFNGALWILRNKENPAEIWGSLSASTNCPLGVWTLTELGNERFINVVSEPCEPILSARVLSSTSLNSPDYTVYDHFETFGECKNGVCPPPVFKNNRTVRPGYNTPNCNPAEYDKITCKFADVMYKVVLEKRYGITNCCPDEDEKWLLKKELIDLQAIRDPNYKCEACGCPCKSGKTKSSCNCGN